MDLQIDSVGKTDGVPSCSNSCTAVVGLYIRLPKPLVIRFLLLLDFHGVDSIRFR
jgi:hypothetical protein